MEQFIPNEEWSIVQIIDESYGYGVLVRGKVNEKNCIAVFDLSLKEDVGRTLSKALRENRIVEAEWSEYPVTPKIIEHSPNTLYNLKGHMEYIGFSMNRTSNRSIVETQYHKVPIPYMRRTVLQENVSRHFKSKVESFFSSLCEHSDVHSFFSYKTLEESIPFIVSRATLPSFNGDTSKVEDIFRGILKETTLVKFQQKDKYIYEVAFTPGEKFLQEVSKFEKPIFPPDTIDGVQRVIFEMNYNLNDFSLAILRRRLVEDGAAINVVKVAEGILIDIPCSHVNSGEYGRAYISRFSHVSKVLEDFPIKYSSFILQEGLYLDQIKRSVLPGQISLDFKDRPHEAIAYFKKVTSISKEEIPNLFEGTEGDELFLDCGDGNYMGFRKTSKSVDVYQGVALGCKRKELSDYYAQVFKIGKGIA